jgi:integrase
MRKVVPLTDTRIKNAKPKEKNYTLSDGNGLQLLIKINKTKLWEFVFKSPTLNKRRKTSFGNYPTQTSLLNAREKRTEYLDLISRGIDPIDYHKKEKEKILVDVNGNFKNVMYEWLDKESQNTQANTHKGKVRVFENDVLPFLRTKHINIDDIIKIIDLKKISAPEIDSRLFNNMDNLFRYAVLKRYCDRNLLADIRKSDLIKPRTAKHMPKITDFKVLSELISLIYAYKGGYSLRNALKLVLHLPLRAENLCNLKWKYIDFNKRTLTIPREEMKLKNINLDDFVLPLSNEVIKILKEQETIQTKYTHLKEFIFLGRDNDKSINKESPNRVLERLGFNDESRGRKIRLHGFRGTFRSMIDTLDIESKFSFDVKERALDHHEKNEVARAYNHKANYLEQLKPLMNYWSDYILSLKNS